MNVLVSLERIVFTQLNRVLEPRVRAGWACPGALPVGLVVLETRGRRTGQRRRLPLAAMRLGDVLLVGTFRGRRSNWIRNAAANPSVGIWTGGERRAGRAFVVGPRPTALPDGFGWLGAALAPWTCAGWAFALLVPAGDAAPVFTPLMIPARP